jgi:glycosyltransferase involved in cell wall biosynthesis
MNPVDSPVLAFAVPCYNEEATLQTTINRLLQLMDEHIATGLIHPDSYMLFVNDGSRDRTWQILEQNKSKRVKALKLSNNVGHQHALLAGLSHAKDRCDCCISIDADLQDDISVIRPMVEAYKKGSHIVYGVRNNRDADTTMKKNTALLFYKLMTALGCDVVYNHADFRLLSNKVLTELQQYREVNLFLRGLFPLMGFTSSKVFYERQKREAGETKYPFKKMLNLAINGITSFSNYPLKIITRIGLIIFFGSILTSLWVAFVVLRGDNVPGWASITLPIYFLGGVQLLALGIIGEYLGKIYLEAKGRPRYHIEEEM